MVTVKEDGIVTRDELLAMGCTESVLRKTAFYFMKGERVIARNCTKCSSIKLTVHMGKDKRMYKGLKSWCLVCVRADNRKYRETAPQEVRDLIRDRQRTWYKSNLGYSREYRKANRERTRENERNWNASNPERARERGLKWREANPEVILVISQRRRARKVALPDDLTAVQLRNIIARFHNTCALSGEPTDLHDDHVIPISIGHGGTTFGNMIPLRGDLNISKHNAHLYEWFDANHERLGLKRDKFNALIEYLAEANEMTPEEYRKYTDWCFDNPRVIDPATGELVFVDATTAG